MQLIADLHVHSKYSRATAKNLDLENIYIWAQKKGIALIGTGDCTHPAWFAEIQTKLIEAEPGLFQLKPELAKSCDQQVPVACRGLVRFILQGEISNIYKKNNRVRKNHQLVFFPDLKSLSVFNSKLDAIGNIKSDGRPILGLDAKHLLEILLEATEQAFLIPAHIWTPWFSVLGSKSGFDSLQECFEDLSQEIFAAETGLSSDPPMNWRVSELDRITLVSNSDAHSPANLGRNANLFDIDLSYFALKAALKTKDLKKCLGTFDMYPEEGKYHLDGHRKCSVCLHPTDTIKNKDLCPTCGKALTIGVLYRVETLANRPDGAKPANALPCTHIIPLPEILSEIYQCGVKSKKVQTRYDGVLQILGSELNILSSLSLAEIEKANIPLLAEAIQRMRNAKIYIQPGYDGEFGKIKVFRPEELRDVK
ncbi:MAG: endonuclease Q family protein [Pseudomonadota bacterium]